MKRYTIAQFNADFPDEAACLEYVAALVHPGFPEIHCRTCGEMLKHHRLGKRKAYSCQRCGTHVYPLAGTIFEKSRTPLKSWFYAMYLMASTRMGISAKQLERELGVTYKTAWRMFKQIRALMAEDGGPLRGTVEVDETYVGGKPRNKQPRKGARPRSNPTAKKPVVGMVERGGDVKAWVTSNVRSATIRPLMETNVLAGSTVYTDDARHYGLVRKSGYEHERVNHTARVYVDGDVHTNTIEGFWCLLKNGIRGAHRMVGVEYLQDYANEYTFRYNHRDDETPMFTTLASRVKHVRTGRLGTYSRPI